MGIYYTLSDSIRQAINLCYNTNIIDEKIKYGKKFDEKICLSYSFNSRWHNTFVKPSDLDSYLKDLLLEKDRNYYITNSSLYGSATNRKSESLFSFHNIIMDIDAHAYLESHELDEEFNEFVDKLIWAVKRDCNEALPNFAVKTGRGVQFWWNLEEASKSIQFAYSRAVNVLYTAISNIIQEHNLTMFEVDQASKKPIGLFRLPGSFNCKTSIFTEVVPIHNKKFEIFALNDYMNDWFDIKSKGLPQKRKTSNKKKKTIIPIDRSEPKYDSLMHSRKKFIEYMVKNNTISEGHREVAIWLYYNNARQIPWDSKSPKEATIELNSLLSEPLSKSQMQSIFNNNNIYKIKKATFFDYLGVDIESEEYKNMTDKIFKSNLTRDLKRKTKKYERDERVRMYYRNGNSISSISKELHMGRNTIKKILKESGMLPANQSEQYLREA